jgi:hypothetical protein
MSQWVSRSSWEFSFRLGLRARDKVIDDGTWPFVLT